MTCLVPLALVVLVVFGTALGSLLAAANVYLRDVQYLVELGLMFWFWMTPIVYAWTTVKTAWSATWDGLAVRRSTCSTRWRTSSWHSRRRCGRAGRRTGRAFVYGGNLALRLGVLPSSGLGLLWFAQRVFARAQGNFAQEL